jgi:hypothetical protein
MRFALAFAVVVLAVSAPAFAEPASRSAPHPAAQSFREQTSQFEWEMGSMRQDMSRAVNILETREIAARYQPVADAFADRIESRRLEEGRLTGRYSNARIVRELPDRVRQDTDRTRLSSK